MDYQQGTAITLRALRTYYPEGNFARKLHPLPDYGCIYVRNAKAATSTILFWLHLAHTGHKAWGNIHKRHKLPDAHNDVGLWRTVRMLRGQAFRFTFVREPIRRAESAYLDKIANLKKGDQWRARIREVLELPPTPGEPLSFDQFVDALERQEPILMDPHWRPQHLNLMHPLLEFDLVGRLETFDADIARVRAATGLPDLPIMTRNVSSKRPASLFDGRPDLLRRVRDVYARDLELYGY